MGVVGIDQSQDFDYTNYRRGTVQVPSCLPIKPTLFLMLDLSVNVQERLMFY